MPALCFALVLAAPFAAGDLAGAASRDDLQTTFLLSKAGDGGYPNGPSRNPAISQDGRQAKVIGFESDASNITPGDTNGQTDIFATFRTGTITENGDPWQPGRTELISKGLGGQPANGPSSKPDVSGDFGQAPECIAFVSAASNLVPGDTNGVPDAFVYNLTKRSMQRVSVPARGGQSNGESFDVSIDGECERIAFTSTASNLALKSANGLGKARKRAWKTAKTGNGPPGSKQVYVRVIKGPHLFKYLKKLTFLASATNGRKAGRGDSFDPDFAIRRGDRLAFTSTATLAKGDSNGAGPDVYLRKLDKGISRGSKKKGIGPTVAQFKLKTSIVSHGGNAASSAPSLDGVGKFVQYQTDASNILPGDTNGVSDVARADTSRSPPQQVFASKSGRGIGNGGSFLPASSGGGTNGAFSSDASNFDTSGAGFEAGDVNGARDSMIWTANRDLAILVSKSSSNGPLRLGATNVVTSARTNYLLMESNDPFADLPFVQAVNPGFFANPSAAYARAQNEPPFHQIYLRYLGPE